MFQLTKVKRNFILPWILPNLSFVLVKVINLSESVNCLYPISKHYASISWLHRIYGQHVEVTHKHANTHDCANHFSDHALHNRKLHPSYQGNSMSALSWPKFLKPGKQHGIKVLDSVDSPPPNFLAKLKMFLIPMIHLGIFFLYTGPNQSEVGSFLSNLGGQNWKISPSLQTGCTSLVIISLAIWKSRHGPWLTFKVKLFQIF